MTKKHTDRPEEKMQNKQESEMPSEKIQNEQEDVDSPSCAKHKDQLTAMEMKIEDFKNQYLRAEAELQNVRRRAERDIANAHKFGSEKLLNDLLPIMDSMIRGLAGPELSDPQAKVMREGMKLTLDLLEKTLARHGVETIDPKPGEVFDPSSHEAVAATSDPDKKTNAVVEVVQKGFRLNGRVLRAAMVVVSK